MSKVNLASVGVVTDATTVLNNNFDEIEDGFDNTLSRDGTAPNAMGADIDMDSNRIFNLPTPQTSTEAARLQDIEDAIAAAGLVMPEDITAASLSEATTGVDNQKYMTPLRTLQSINANERQRADQTQAEAGASNTVDMTPLRTAQFLAENSNLSKVDDTTNRLGDADDGIEIELLDIGAGIHREVRRPRGTGLVPAIDVVPSVGAAAVGGRLGWWEFCSEDFLANPGDPFYSMRMAVTTTGGTLGTFVFNAFSATPLPITFYVSGAIVGSISDPIGAISMVGGFRGTTYSIPDGSAQAIDVPVTAASKFCVVLLQRNSESAPSPCGFWRIHAGTGASAPTPLAQVLATDINSVTGILTGSTGAANKITLSCHTNGKFYIENQSGGSVSISVTFFPQAG